MVKLAVLAPFPAEDTREQEDVHKHEDLHVDRQARGRESVGDFWPFSRTPCSHSGCCAVLVSSYQSWGTARPQALEVVWRGVYTGLNWGEGNPTFPAQLLSQIAQIAHDNLPI